MEAIQGKALWLASARLNRWTLRLSAATASTAFPITVSAASPTSISSVVAAAAATVATTFALVAALVPLDLVETIVRVRGLTRSY